MDSRKLTTPGPAFAAPDTNLTDRIVRLRDGATEVAYCTPDRASRWLVKTRFTEEPDTIGWIRGFRPRDVLADVRAKFAMYSIWAAKTCGMRVHAFKPESQNVALLNKNIISNGLDGKRSAEPIGDAGVLRDLVLYDMRPKKESALQQTRPSAAAPGACLRMLTNAFDGRRQRAARLN